MTDPADPGQLSNAIYSQEATIGAPDLSAIPAKYQDLWEVFSKARATSLLAPHRLGDDCTLCRAGFFFVEIKDKILRTCIDYRGLNDITVKNRYPLPLISSAFKPLQWATVFSKLDLRNTYHMVRIREGDEWKTAFNMASSRYEYLVMPFGLTNAPAVFQDLENDVLCDMLNRFVFVYIDDILIFSCSPHEHVLHVQQVLQRILENQLFVKPEKCEFHCSTIPFLGYIISAGSVKSFEDGAEEHG
eukprot:XP_013983796.1 PREDICTED: RNA-directed DNA polymerase homolog [Salmo salar]